LSEQIPLHVAENLQFYTTPQAIDECSVYRLYPLEKFLFAKYYKPGDRILDLACGLGRTTLRLHEMGFSVRGLDASEVLINIANRRFPYLELRVSSFACIEELNSSYSHVLISSNALDLAFPESERVTALHECARVLKPGGTLIYSSHNVKSLHFFSPRYWRRLLWKLRNSQKAFKARAYITEGSLHGLFASPEFVIQQTESIGFKYLEMIGPRMSRDWWRNRYCSIYIHYAFQKPAAEGD